MPFINGKFYMNPGYGRAVERARGAEPASRQREQEQDQDAHWVTIDGRHVLIQGAKARPNSRSLPPSGVASIYSDFFEGKKTANGETFHQDGYTGALLPRTRWRDVPLGTRVDLTNGDNRVVVEVNDRGNGDRNPHSTRVLDLSRAAASALTGRDINDDDDARSVGLIRLDRIKVMSSDTTLGPVLH